MRELTKHDLRVGMKVIRIWDDGDKDEFTVSGLSKIYIYHEDFSRNGKPLTGHEEGSFFIKYFFKDICVKNYTNTPLLTHKQSLLLDIEILKEKYPNLKLTVIIE